MTTPDDILNRTTRDMLWRDLAAIHIHAALLVANHGVYREEPDKAASRAVQHVNALAVELARTQVPD